MLECRSSHQISDGAQRDRSDAAPPVRIYQSGADIRLHPLSVLLDLSAQLPDGELSAQPAELLARRGRQGARGVLERIRFSGRSEGGADKAGVHYGIVLWRQPTHPG